MKLFYSIIVSFASVIGYSQTILHQQESITRTVQDPQMVVLGQGFRATSGISNPFVAKIGGPATENPGGGPTDSQAGANNPSGSTSPQQESYHNTKGKIDVTGSGQLQFTLVIDLPKGVKEVAPNLDLAYLSGSGNGIAGYGWSVSGITTISRGGKTIEKDGEMQGLQLDYSDYYYFNGQRLILKSGEYGKNGAEYVTEKYSIIKIKSIGSIAGQQWQGPAYWEITFEDGSQAWYGGLSSGTNTSRTPIEYNIVKWKDNKGNFITYNYIQNNNIAAISNIQWEGNENIGVNHFNQVNFYYSQRNVKESSFIKGIPLIQDKKLSQISVLSNNILFKNYSIQYSTNQNIIDNDVNNKINYDFVEKIIETNSAGEEANPVTISTKPLATSTTEGAFGDYSEIITSGDYNGDGLVDFLVKQPTQNGRPEGYYIYFDSLNSSSPNYVYIGASNSFFNTKFITYNIHPADNIIKPKQGLVLIKNIQQNNQNTGVSIKYYNLNNNVQYNTFNFPLNLEYEKNIITTEFEFDDITYPFTPPSNANYVDLIKNSEYVSAMESDINSDGMSELVIAIKDSRKYKYEHSGNSGGAQQPCISIDPDSTVCYWWTEQRLGYRYIVIDRDNIINNTVSVVNTTTSKNILSNGGIMDFDNDGKQDIMFIDPANTNVNVTYYTKSYINGNIGSKTSSTPVNNLIQYELKKQNDNYTINLKKNFTVKGLVDGIHFGDLNGDKNIEVLLPLHQYAVNDEYTTGWSIYLNTGVALEESLQGLMLYKTNTASRPDILSNYSVLDIDGDGKGEIVNSYTFFTNINTNQSVNWRLDSYSEPYYNIYDSQFKWRFKERRLMSSDRPKSVISPLFGDFRVNNSLSKVVFLLKAMDTNERKIISYQHYNLNTDKNISAISQADLQYDIEYKELDPAININLYAPIKKEEYPYVEMERLTQAYAVSQIKILGRKQDFRYRGYIAHLQGRGIIGFRQTARSSWYAEGFENTKVWSGVEIDPLKEGIPVKEWSIRTNDESKIFPADISVNNSQLLSFKSTDYQINKLLNGQAITTISDANKPKIVTAILPYFNLTKDFLTNTITNNTITYGDYYLPNESISNVNTGYAITTSVFEYNHNVSGIGSDYYIGRPKSKTIVTQAYGDTKSTKQEYTYENNLIKILKTWNRDNTGYLLEDYTYDDFGNIAQKIISNSIDSQINTTKADYGSNGRFAIKKIDNLGLQTDITYNVRGQIKTETDPLGNVVTNTYDNWGKLLKSKNNLSGTTTYTYDKTGWTGDVWSGWQPPKYVVTEYLSNGDQTITYVNILGQNYKTSTKSFEQGQFVSINIRYDDLGRKTGESEPYFEGQSPSLWNILTYDDTVFPPKITATALASLDYFTGAITSFTGKKIETSVSGSTTMVKELNGYNRTNSKTTDVLGNVTSSTDKGGTIQFSYNAAGEQIQAQYAENIVKTKYDTWGRKSEFNDPSNGLYKYEYDGLGQPKKIISPKGTKEFTYNNLGQLLSQQEISTTDGGQATNKIIIYSYDNKGRIISRAGTSKGKTFSFNVSFDPQGRVLSSSESSNSKYFIQKGITYDDKARVTSYEKQLYSSGVLTKVQIENVYNAWNGELYQMKDKISGKVLWQLEGTNAKGQVLSAKLGSSTITNLYDINGFLSTINHSSQIKPSILQISYSFNAIKNELNSRTTGGDFNVSEIFNYDDNNRLINWTNPRTGSNSQNTYDVKGRILANDQVGTIKFENSSKIYQATGMTLNAEGTQNYNNDLIQSIIYNENNDPVFIDGEKGDVAFQYGLTSMRQRVTYGGNFSIDGDGKFTKFYSEDGSFEVVKDNTTGKEKHILYIGGSPYESNIIYLKNYDETSGSYKFLHKDYLGSVLAISDEAGNKLEQRHFDAWGNFTHLQIGNGPIFTDKNIIDNSSLLLERGYTSHEHFAEVGIIHMNGRLYDPLLRRFLNADENIQDPTNTQNYNKYGYVMNNPLMFNDPSGEFIFAPIVAAIIVGALKAVVIGALIYTGMAAITGNASKAGFLKTVLTSAIVGGISGGVGALNVFGNGFWGVVANGAALGAAGGAVDAIVNNTNVLQGVIKGAVIGAAAATVSYIINYYTTSTGSKTSVIEDTSENTVEGNTPVGDRAYARDLYEKEFGTQSGLDKNNIYNRAIDGGKMTCNCSEGVIKYNYKGKLIDALAVTDSQTVDHGFWKGKITTHKIFLSHKAFASKEQLAFVMQHELGHVRVFNAGLRSVGDKKIELDGDTAKKYSTLLDNAEHYHIQQYGTQFLENNGWNNIRSSVPSNVFNNTNFKMYNQQIFNVLKGTAKAININFK